MNHCGLSEENSMYYGSIYESINDPAFPSVKLKLTHNVLVKADAKTL